MEISSAREDVFLYLHRRTAFTPPGGMTPEEYYKLLDFEGDANADNVDLYPERHDNPDTEHPFTNDLLDIGYGPQHAPRGYKTAVDWDKLKHPRDNAGEFTSKFGNGLHTTWKRRTTEKGAHVYEGKQDYDGRPMSEDNTPLLEQDPKSKKWTVANRDEHCGHTFYSEKGKQYDTPKEAGDDWLEHISAYNNLSDHRKHLHAGGEDDGACAYNPGRPLNEQMQVADKTGYGDESWKSNLDHKTKDESPEGDFGGTTNRGTIGDDTSSGSTPKYNDDGTKTLSDIDSDEDDQRRRGLDDEWGAPGDVDAMVNRIRKKKGLPPVDSKHDPRFYSAPVIPVYADAKQFPKSDFGESQKGQTCSRWGCDKPAVSNRETGQGSMGACREHTEEMKKD